MNESGTGTASALVEERLRAALAARARSVGPADLRPLRPPVAQARPGRVRLRLAVVGVLALAAVAALVFFTVRDAHPGPSGPARPPRPTTGTPSPAPSPPGPLTAQPSPSARRP
ncbi:hypothetical protein ACGFT2_03705 [Streptomyces sp. NPDC048514]|uniref:hypothetical protein n=1 Tax=Streptomyces sp. NPDC048514 TaxID=3365564 RepID=UPI00371A5809